MSGRLLMNKRSTQILLSASLLAIVALGLWLGLALSLTVLSAVSGAVAVALAAVQVWLAWLTLRRTPAPEPRRADELGDAESAITLLANAVRGAWADEGPRRRLADPGHLPISWGTIGPPLADHWENIRRDGSPEPMVLDGTLTAAGKDNSSLLTLISGLETRGRTVLLGEPGSGKTVLLLRLMLDALAVRSPGGPVPVILRLATWNLPKEKFYEWVSTRLVEDYGCSREGSVLITTFGNIIPILDGLDEMPAERRPMALRAINSSLTGDTSFIVASRTSEYVETLVSIDADVLTGSAVVEIQPLAPPLIRDYLIRATPPGRAQRWSKVFDLDQTDHDGRLADALSTPLAVSLARTIYADHDRDPEVLLELADDGTVEGHLLDQLIPNLYSDLVVQRFVRIGPPWTMEQAQRWLGFLAGHIRARGTYDIAWWEFAHAVPRWFRVAAGTLIGAAAGGLIGTFTGGPTGGLRGGLSYGFAAALVGALAGWITCGAGAWHGWLPEPSRVGITIRRSKQRFFKRIAHALWLGLSFGPASGLIFGLGVGLKFGLENGIVSGLEDGILFGIISGLLVGLVLGFANEFTTMFGESFDTSGAVDAMALLRADRNRWVITALTIGFTLAFALRLTGELLAPLAKPLAVTNTGSIVVGLTIGFAGGIVLRAWGWLAIARVWLSVTRRTPWSVLSFLANAHGREALRQVGGIYQFRHALLRDQLANWSSRKAGSPRLDGQG
jgi:NACHT domain